MADFDNDGFLDILLVNGHIYPQVDQLKFESYKQPRRLYFGHGNATFREAGVKDGWTITGEFSSRGLAAADFDNDGDVDVLIANHNQAPTLLRNECGGNFLNLTLVGSGANVQAVGARVALKVAGRTMWRFLIPNQGYLSSHDPRLHFGLGDANRVEEIIIHWPDGYTQRISGYIAGNRFLTVIKGKGLAGEKER